MKNFNKIIMALAIVAPIALNFAMDINIGTFRAKTTSLAPEQQEAGKVQLIITNNTSNEYVIFVGNEQYTGIQPGQQNIRIERPVPFLANATLNIPGHVNVSNLMVRNPMSRHTRNLLQIAISRDTSDGTFGAFMFNTSNATHPIPLAAKTFHFDAGRPDYYTINLTLAGDNLQNSTLEATMENN